MRLQVEPKRRPRDSKLSPGGGQAWPSAIPKRPCKVEVEPKSFQVAKTRKSSSRAGESSTLRVARAPKIDPRSAKLHLECGLESQVEPKRRQVALGVRLGRPSWSSEGQDGLHRRVYRAQLGVQEARVGSTDGCTGHILASRRRWSPASPEDSAEHIV